MKFIKYDYKIVQGWIDTHPLINFLLIGKKKTIPLKGIVDTGSYFTILHSYFAEEVGYILPEKVNQKLETVNGITWGKLINADIKFMDDFSQRSLIINTNIVFVDNLKFSKEAVLLGRFNIFNKFKEVAFSENTINKNVKFKY